MNIHITESEFKELNKLIILSIRVGSHLYGLNNADSDTDILNIYAAPEDNLHAVVQSHHQFQYKSENTDYLFCSLQSFVKNILMGDSPLNFEALDSWELKNHADLKWLADFKSNFRSYQLIKSYLGLARRDVKSFKKNKSSKKIFHAYRGLLTAKAIFDNKNYTNDWQCFTPTERATLKAVKNNKISVETLVVLSDEITQELEQIRKDLNSSLEQKQISKIMKLDKLIELETWIVGVSKQHSQPGCFFNETYVNSIQSEIEYE